jgi:charged multivesicular body protein 6
MKNQRDALHKYQRRITFLTDRETEIAKQLLAKGDKPRALLALRRKKYQQSLLAQTDGQLEQLEKLTSSVEFALVQKDVVFGLQQGTKVLAEINKEMGGIDHVEKLLEENAEARAVQEEISEMLGVWNLSFECRDASLRSPVCHISTNRTFKTCITFVILFDLFRTDLFIGQDK